MEAETRAIENKRIRGIIMRRLATVFPPPLKVQVGSSALLASGDITSPDIGAYLAYLEGKEYIKVYMSEHDERLPVVTYPPEMLVVLVWRGVDLLEGTTEDPGVII